MIISPFFHPEAVEFSENSFEILEDCSTNRDGELFC
jgi:hypothetical protein